MKTEYFRTTVYLTEDAINILAKVKKNGIITKKYWISQAIIEKWERDHGGKENQEKD